ncbi:MAG: hypothetical protein ABIP65_07425 [Vicinamibacterales bacterium]
MISAICGVVVAAACGGCLQKEVGQTIYLGPSGAVWSVIERDIRSDEKEPASRIREEQDYVLAAHAGQHGVARAFRSLGALSVTTTWLRRERPYSVMTEARFTDVRQLAMAILREGKAQGDVTLVRDGCRTRLGIQVNLEPAPESNDGSPLDALFADPETYRFVLSEGRFMSGDGFEILDEGTIAVPDGKKTATDGMLTLALAWADEGCPLTDVKS